MSSDFGDESGEKLFDWLLRICQDGSEQAMIAGAERLASAFRIARGEIAGEQGDTMREASVEWAKLSMKQFADLPEYESIKEIIDGKLGRQSIEHSFFSDEGAEYLLFRIEDAPDVSRAFEDLEGQTEEACEKALEARGKTREQVRDAQPLDERAAAAREEAKAISASRCRESEIGRTPMRSK